jgi:hypothetical protein
MYRGLVIAESLLDWAWINQVRAVGARITRDPNDPNDLWHLYTVEATEEQVRALERLLKPTGYYAHFSNAQAGLVVFPHKSFRVDPQNNTTWQAAIDFGVAIGIPGEQMDFGFDGLGAVNG